MKKALIISSVLGALFLVAVAGYGIYWQHKLEPILSSPAALLVPTRFEPVSVSKTKSLNLGYVRLSVPQSIDGQLEYFTDTNIIVLTNGEGISSRIAFMPPIHDRDAGSISLYKMVAQLTGTSADSRFEFQKCLATQRPVSVWQIFSLGIRQFRARAALLSLKRVVYSTATSVRLFDNERIGLIVQRDPNIHIVTLTDLKSGFSQEVLIPETFKNADEIISAIASDYELKLPAVDDHSIERLIKGVGMKAVAESPPSSAAESQRYEGAAREIQRRRLLREQPKHP
jgi:hypothetical protein